MPVRPIIIPANAEVVLENISKYKQISYNYDGFKTEKLIQGDKIIIKRYKNNLKLITSPDRNFFDILREKFGWVE